MSFISVALEQKIGKPLDYAIPKPLLGSIHIGQLVEVPLPHLLKKANVSTQTPFSNKNQQMYSYDAANNGDKDTEKNSPA